MLHCRLYVIFYLMHCVSGSRCAGKGESKAAAAAAAVNAADRRFHDLPPAVDGEFGVHRKAASASALASASRRFGFLNTYTHIRTLTRTQMLIHMCIYAYTHACSQLYAALSRFGSLTSSACTLAHVCLCICICICVGRSRMCEKEVLRYHLRLFVFTPPTAPHPSSVLFSSSQPSEIAPHAHSFAFYFIWLFFFFFCMYLSLVPSPRRLEFYDQHSCLSDSLFPSLLLLLLLLHLPPLHLLSPISTHFRLHFVNQTNNAQCNQDPLSLSLFRLLFLCVCSCVFHNCLCHALCILGGLHCGSCKNKQQVGVLWIEILLRSWHYFNVATSRAHLHRFNLRSRKIALSVRSLKKAQFKQKKLFYVDKKLNECSFKFESRLPS